jgi:hypothetical protein
VVYVFDKDQELAAVLMEMGKDRFNDVFKILSAKYKLTAEERPFVGNMLGRFKAKGATIELNAPHMSFEMNASYLRDDFYARVKTQSAQETEQRKAAEKARF